MIPIKRFVKCSPFIIQLLILITFSFINFSDSLLYCTCNDHNKCLINDKEKLGNLSKFYCIIQEKGLCFAARVIDVETSVQPITAKIVYRYGCLSTDTRSILSCKGHFFNSTIPVAMGCCNNTVFCNAKLNPKFYHFDSDKSAVDFAISHKKPVTVPGVGKVDDVTQLGAGAVMLVVCVSLLAVCMSVCIAVVCYCKQRLHWASKRVLGGQGGVSRICGGAGVGGVQVSALLPVHPPPHSQTATSGSLMTASSLLTTTNTNFSHYRLTQRTIGHQILFTQVLGRGRFSEVWAGDWLGDLVAVKHLYQSGQLKLLPETLWLRTIGLYYSHPVQHNHVISLLGSDKIPPDHTGPGPCSLTLVLIYPYFHWGTLSRLMASSHWDLSAPQEQQPTHSRLDTLYRMAFSLVSGLCYLHTEIAATKGKPAMAHRNLKASNVYVKDDYSCCIGDLEWALIGGGKDDDRCNLDSHIMPLLTAPNGLVQMPDFEYYVSNVLLVTDCRYVAPELLAWSDTGNGRTHSSISVEDYKKSDVYSLSLILWELLVWFEPSLKQSVPSSCSEQRSQSQSIFNWIYEPAYQAELIKLRQSLACDSSYLYDEPRPAEMHILLFNQCSRPIIDTQVLSSNHPSSNETIVDLLCQIIPQCWCSVPDSRLSCLKMKKYLSSSMESPPVSTAPSAIMTSTAHHTESL